MWQKLTSKTPICRYPKPYERVLVRTNQDTFIGWINRDYEVWFIQGLGTDFDCDVSYVKAWHELPKFSRKEQGKMTSLQVLTVIVLALIGSIFVCLTGGEDK